MQDRKIRRFQIYLLVATLAFLVSCSSESSVATGVRNETGTAENRTSQQTNQQTSSNSGCDPKLWDHVYNPERLAVLDQCKVVTGVIDELDQNEDGDTHMLLKLDPGNDDLLLKKNRTKKNGDLVIEVVCAHPVTDKKAIEACRGYSTNVKIPNVGDHVKVTGSYVNDSHNNWAEIHPVSNIEKM